MGALPPCEIFHEKGGVDVKVIFAILVIYLFMKGVIYKLALLILSRFIKERDIQISKEEVHECAKYVSKNEWFKILF